MKLLRNILRLFLEWGHYDKNDQLLLSYFLADLRIIVRSIENTNLVVNVIVISWS
jgi:hypothetical protein